MEERATVVSKRERTGIEVGEESKGDCLVNDDIERLVREAEQAHRKKVQSADKAFASSGEDPGKQLVRRESAKIFESVAIFVIAAQSLYVFGFNYCWVLLIPLALYGTVKLKRVRSRKRGLKYRINPIDRVSVGSYVEGFDEIKRPLPAIECLIGESDFIFVLRNREELVRIPRYAVNHISVVDRVTAVKSPTLPGKLARGFYVLLAGRGGKEREAEKRCLAIDWETGEGTNQSLLFEFSGPNANEEAYSALNILYKYLMPRSARPEEDERTCPYCAEVIRKNAFACMHCGKYLGPPRFPA
jgi:hypothetical protein